VAARTERVACIAPGRLQARRSPRSGGRRSQEKPAKEPLPPVVLDLADQNDDDGEVSLRIDAVPAPGSQGTPSALEVVQAPPQVPPSRWYDHPWRNLDGPRSLVHLEMHRGSLEAMLYLSERTKSSKGAIYQALCPNGQTLDRCLDSLIRLGLVNESRQSAFPFRKSYSLSKRGAQLVCSPLAYWPGLLQLK
jgi:hypothetical protein